MNSLSVPRRLIEQGRVQLYDRIVGDELRPHFDWADMVSNPGHVGLLVMNAAKHGKGIVIDSDCAHAPEYYLAREAAQPFISFGDDEAVDRFIDGIINDRALVVGYAEMLQDIAIKEYTVQNMAKVHFDLFREMMLENN